MTMSCTCRRGGVSGGGKCWVSTQGKYVPWLGCLPLWAWAPIAGPCASLAHHLSWGVDKTTTLQSVQLHHQPKQYTQSTYLKGYGTTDPAHTKLYTSLNYLDPRCFYQFYEDSRKHLALNLLIYELLLLVSPLYLLLCLYLREICTLRAFACTYV